MAKRKNDDEAEYSAPSPKKEKVSLKGGSSDLTDIIAKELDKKFGKDNPESVFFLGEDDNSYIGNVTDWVPTGIVPLDFAISNRPNGGYPAGRIIELVGLSSSGKSLLAAHALAETQKKNGIAVFIDTEAALSREYLEAIGVKLNGDNKLMVITPDTVEMTFAYIENIINTVRNSSKDRLVTIVVDSLSALSTDVEMDATYDQAGYATQKAIIISKAMRKINNLIARQKICVIITNQYRTKMNAMAFSSPYCVDPFSTEINIRYTVPK